MQEQHLAIIDVGSNESYVMALTEGLKHHGVKVHIYSDFATQEVRGKQFFKKDASLLSHLYGTIKSIKDAKSHGVKLLILPMLQPTIKNIVILALAKFYELPIAVIEGDVGSYIQDKHPYRYRLIYEYLASFIVVQNRFAHEQFIGDINEKTIHKVSHFRQGNYLNAMDKPITSELARYRLGLDKKRKYLLFEADTIQSSMGLDVAIEALSFLEDREIQLIIASPSIEKSEGECGMLIKELKVDNQIVKLSKELSTQEREWLIYASDMWLFCDRQSYKNSHIIQAMGYGTPLIVSDIPPHQEMIKSRHNGIVFASNNAQALAKAIEELFANPTLKESIAKEAFKDIRDHYLWEESAKGYLKLIS